MTGKVEDPADQLVEWAPRQEPFVGQPADQDQQLGLDQRELPIEVRPAEIDLGAARASVSSAAAFAGKALGDRRQVDLPPGLPFRCEARTDQPSHERRPRPSLERQPADRLDRAGRLADEHDAVVRVPAQNGGGLWKVTPHNASGTGADLAVKSGKGRWGRHGADCLPEWQGASDGPRLNTRAEGRPLFACGRGDIGLRSDDGRCAGECPEELQRIGAG